MGEKNLVSIPLKREGRPPAEVFRRPPGSVSDVLFQAFGILGLQPTKPFATIQDFQADIIQRYPVATEAKKFQQLQWVLQAVTEAEARRVSAVVQCIRNIQDLARELR